VKGTSLKILHVINRLSTGGAENSLRQFLIGSVDEADHAVVVMHRDGNRFYEVAAAGIRTFVPTASVGSYPARVRMVRRVIREFEPDLVHTSLFEANTAGRIAGRLENVPVLTSLVNTPYVPAARVDRDVHRWKLAVVRSVDLGLSRRWTTHFHAITEAVADEYVRDFRLARADITVVPRGRSPEGLGQPDDQRREDARRRLGVAPSQPLLLAVGRQEAQKGHRVALAAMPGILSSHPETKLLIAGREGAVTGRLRSQQRRLGLGDAVVFLGLRDDVPDLLAAADVFVFPSLHEGLGGAVVEAMAMGLPIIASDIPALREVLDGGSCGVLVRPGDASELASACLGLLEERQRARALGDAARSRFDSTYTSETAIEGMLALYRRLVSHS
jgi:glycosyltransferase involved in cell wall biosynthesis